MDPSSFTAAFATALMLSLAVKFWLATRQMHHVAAHRDRVPDAFAATVTPEAHRRAADYTLAKGRFGLLASALGSAVLLGSRPGATSPTSLRCSPPLPPSAG